MVTRLTVCVNLRFVARRHSPAWNPVFFKTNKHHLTLQRAVGKNKAYNIRRTLTQTKLAACWENNWLFFFLFKKKKSLFYFIARREDASVCASSKSTVRKMSHVCAERFYQHAGCELSKWTTHQVKARNWRMQKSTARPLLFHWRGNQRGARGVNSFPKWILGKHKS